MNNKFIQWHPGFQSAIHLELMDDSSFLEFKDEYTLNSKPLVLDLLVIKKDPNHKIMNAIGTFFLGHNILEYKSPDDILNADTYFKVYAYACLYRSGEIHPGIVSEDDITITFVRKRYPFSLMKFFYERNYQIIKHTNGIYYVMKDGFFPTQIIVTSKLKGSTHIWLCALTKKLNPDLAQKLVNRAISLKGKKESVYADSVMQVAIQANLNLFAKMKGEQNMCQALLELMAPEIQEQLDKINAEKKAAEEYAAQIMKEAAASKKEAAASKKEAAASRKEAAASRKEAAASKKEAAEAERTLIETCRELGQSYEETITRIINRLGLSKEDAQKKMLLYWS